MYTTWPVPSICTRCSDRRTTRSVSVANNHQPSMIHEASIHRSPWLIFKIASMCRPASIRLQASALPTSLPRPDFPSQFPIQGFLQRNASQRLAFAVQTQPLSLTASELTSKTPISRSSFCSPYSSYRLRAPSRRPPALLRVRHFPLMSLHDMTMNTPYPVLLCCFNLWRPPPVPPQSQALYELSNEIGDRFLHPR